MEPNDQRSLLQRARKFVLHQLFVLDHRKVRNVYLLLLADFLELAALMFYLLGSQL